MQSLSKHVIAACNAQIDQGPTEFWELQTYFGDGPIIPRRRPGPRPKWNYPGQNENTQACSNGNCGVTGGRGDLGEFKVEAKVIVKAKDKVKIKVKNLGEKLTA